MRGVLRMVVLGAAVASVSAPLGSAAAAPKGSVSDARSRWGLFVTRDLVRAIGATNRALGHTATFAIAPSWSGCVVSNTPSVDGPHGSATWRARSPSS